MNENKKYVMVKIMFPWALCVFLVLVNVNLIAQQGEWTLEECIEYARKNNLQVKNKEFDAAIAKNTLETTKAEIFPSLNAAAEQNFSFGRSVDPYSYEFTEDNVISNNFYIYTSLNVFNGLKHWKKRERDHYSLLANQALIEATKNDISLSIALAYMQILFDNEILKINKQQVAVTQQQLERTEKLLEAGTVARGSLLEIKSQLANEQLEVVNAQNNLDFSVLGLVQLLELDSVAGFTVASPGIDEPSLLPGIGLSDSAMSFSLEQLPEITASKYLINSYEKELAMRVCDRYPSLSLTGSVYTGYSNARVLFNENGEEILYPFPDQFTDNAYRSVGLNLRVPVFNNLSVKNSIESAKVQVLKAENNLAQTRNEIRKKIQEAYAQAVAAYKKYYASKVSLEMANEAFNYAEQKFNLGIISSVDYNTSKNKLAKANSELVQAKYEYVFRKSILDFYAGKPLTIQ